MHSCCLISGIQPGERSPRGPGEYDKHPAFKLRKATRAHDKRLALHLASLDQRCQEMTDRMAHRMKMTSLTLKRIQSKNECGVDLRQSSSNHPVNLESKKTNNNEAFGNVGAQNCVKSSKPTRNDRNGTGNAVKLPQIDCREYWRGENWKPQSRREGRRQGACHYGSPKGGECSHFPCHQPDTYHSIGFRLDDSSTQQWLTWAQLKKAKIDQPNYNTASNVRAPNGGDGSDSDLRRWCSLPMDFESRKQRLAQEIAKRRLQNLANKPRSWETNYGKLTPYKVLAYPVRLHPLQMTTK